MVYYLTVKILGLIISAIKNLRELKGSTTREILHYITSVYKIPVAVARRQMQNALKRGVNYGILKKTDGQYSLPTDNEITRQEVAAQEIGLLDLYCQRKIHRSKGGRTRRNRRTGRSQRVVCRCNKKGMRRRSRGCRSRSCRRRRGGSSGFDRRVHDGTMKSKIEPILDVDKLTDKSTKSNRTMTRANMIDDIERSNSSNMSPEQWDHSISLSC
ncbi:PREDICTED: uncharacterized protein LOC108751802 [Trachymyrmex septentrionalis]|uniref:uncharacterized protein LOC108751802 n=1 Tax=Trachymyrmex septentrionalis TaxID=34720 RepID=UPI00084F260A|nr:PREDICTED: uncharacterized protein LOC108751802 [Trachymyrmex septentrionalis]XP_018347716.1 PREDICTED: uncharacterized protein LOC108751802 [Trachymyrmex septentrionalis]XP_018347717.1 PREDICTED: uncharacterized protein LOC108751802 [Trachymyrmex septentrionalis]